MREITDFGEKIGGAKKDLWKERGLILSDLYGMTTAEINQYVKRDNIWPKLDEKEMLESEGRFLTYWKKQMRSCITPKCTIDAETYIDSVSKFRDAIMSITKEDEIESFCNKASEEDFMHPISRRTYDYAEGFRGVLNGNKFLKLSSNCGIRNMKQKMLGTGFGISKKQFLDEKYQVIELGDSYNCEPDSFNKRYLIVFRYSSGRKYYYARKEEIENRLTTATHVLLDDHVLMAGTKEECVADKKALIETLLNEKQKKKSKNRKKKFVPKQLERIDRRNDIDYRNDFNVSGNDFINAFGIRAGEFGNWQSTKDRQANLNMAFDALLDLADVLNISRKDISLPGLELGSLALAFGSRGSGSAMAHYEPAREVINLTKMKGAGSLAHEWGHALDDFIGKKAKLGSFATNHMKYSMLPDSFNKLVRAMKYKKDGNFTDYYLESRKFNAVTSKDKQGYWTSDCEMFARAFTTFVYDSLGSKGAANDYLCGHAESAITIDEGKIIKAYPQGEERELLNKLFVELFKELKDKDYLHNSIEKYEMKVPQTKQINLDTIKDAKQLSFAF